MRSSAQNRFSNILFDHEIVLKLILFSWTSSWLHTACLSITSCSVTLSNWLSYTSGIFLSNSVWFCQDALGASLKIFNEPEWAPFKRERFRLANFGLLHKPELRTQRASSKWHWSHQRDQVSLVKIRVIRKLFKRGLNRRRYDKSSQIRRFL